MENLHSDFKCFPNRLILISHRKKFVNVYAFPFIYSLTEFSFQMGNYHDIVLPSTECLYG